MRHVASYAFKNLLLSIVVLSGQNVSCSAQTPKDLTSAEKTDVTRSRAIREPLALTSGPYTAPTIGPSVGQCGADGPRVTFRVNLDRGADIGQSFGSLFEVTSRDGKLVVGAGFQNAYNTRLRADRHAVQFFVRPTDAVREYSVHELPRPNDLCGTYLSGSDEVIRSTYGGVKVWDTNASNWRDFQSIGGTEETMRVGSGWLEFGDSTVKYNSKLILPRPDRGSYQLFFYANGHLCFYHVQPGEGGYRPFKDERDGFSKLYACPWTADQPHVDLSRAVVFTLPVVGEMTFAWGQFGQQIVTGSNIGGFYVFEENNWRKLREPNIKVSYQLYSAISLRDVLLMGQYPTGRLFSYDGKDLQDRAGWPPILAGVSSNAREAQTSIIYGGELLVGVWPWGELWRYNPGTGRWYFMQRMFKHPELSDSITHPYDVENRGNAVVNLWGQRVTSLVTNGADVFISTSAKNPFPFEPEKFPFLAPDLWKSYGKVYRLSMPGHLGAKTSWTNGTTTLEFSVRDDQMMITQDGKQIAVTQIPGKLQDQLLSLSETGAVQWGRGIYGSFSGPKLDGTFVR